MTLEELQEKVKLAEEAVAKTEQKIEKFKAQKEKKIAIVNKLLEENGQHTTYQELKEKSEQFIYTYQDTPFHNDFYWACCDVRDKDSSISSNIKVLAEQKEKVKFWKEKLGAEEAKLQYIQDTVPQIIKDFLEEWKRKCIAYYIKKSELYPEALKTYREEKSRLYFDILKETVEKLSTENREEFIKQYCHDNESRFTHILDVLNEGYKENNDYEYHNLIYFHYRSIYDPRNDRRYMDLEENWNARFGDGFFTAFIDHKFDKDWLDKQIEKEKNNKLIELMNRVTKITGTITDAKGLSVESTGDLNGVIIGERGKAKVQTIGAGGYNEHVILDSGRRGQCYHYRVLVNPIK